MDQCGRCHQQITASYFETFHGKVSKLGYLKTAKCYDCHGSHDILPVTDPRSHLSRNNIVATCGKCHTGSHRQFAGYLTHATHHDPQEVPVPVRHLLGHDRAADRHAGDLGRAHRAVAAAVARIPQADQERRSRKPGTYVRRFRRFHRNLHLMVVSSFLGLALTGMILKFSYAGWAKAAGPPAGRV